MYIELAASVVMFLLGIVLLIGINYVSALQLFRVFLFVVVLEIHGGHYLCVIFSCKNYWNNITNFIMFVLIGL